MPLKGSKDDYSTNRDHQAKKFDCHGPKAYFKRYRKHEKLCLPDTPAVGEVPGHTSTSEVTRHRSVEEEMVVNQLLLGLLIHLHQGVVLALQVPAKGIQS